LLDVLLHIQKNDPVLRIYKKLSSNEKLIDKTLFVGYGTAI
jgi:hypothetical protein